MRTIYILIIVCFFIPSPCNAELMLNELLAGYKIKVQIPAKWLPTDYPSAHASSYEDYEMSKLRSVLVKDLIHKNGLPDQVLCKESTSENCMMIYEIRDGHRVVFNVHNSNTAVWVFLPDGKWSGILIK